MKVLNEEEIKIFIYFLSLMSKKINAKAFVQSTLVEFLYLLSLVIESKVEVRFEEYSLRLNNFSVLEFLVKLRSKRESLIQDLLDAGILIKSSKKFLFFYYNHYKWGERNVELSQSKKKKIEMFVLCEKEQLSEELSFLCEFYISYYLKAPGGWKAITPLS